MHMTQKQTHSVSLTLNFRMRPPCPVVTGKHKMDSILFVHFLFLVFLCPTNIHFDFQVLFETEKRRMDLGV